MSNVNSRGEKWATWRYAAIDEHLTFDLKPEKLVYCSVKVNSRFFIKRDARAMTDDQTTRNKPANQQTSNNTLKSTRTIYYQHILFNE